MKEQFTIISSLSAKATNCMFSSRLPTVRPRGSRSRQASASAAFSRSVTSSMTRCSVAVNSLRVGGGAVMPPP